MSARDYDHVMGFLSPHLSVPDRLLDEHEPHPADVAEAEMQFDVVYQDALTATLRGHGKFWQLGHDGYDNEQYLDVFRAVSAALRLPCASDAGRWRSLQRVINRLADEYANDVANGDAT